MAWRSMPPERYLLGGVISRVTIVITHITGGGTYNPRITTHEPPSRDP